MKRLVSVFLVIVFVISMSMVIVPGLAADDHIMKDTAEDMASYLMLCLKEYRNLYEKNPYSFSDAQAYALYYYYTAYEAVRNVYEAELYLSLTESSSKLIMGLRAAPAIVDARYEMSKNVIDMFYEWEKGKQTRGEFLKELIKYVDATINVYGKEEESESVE